MQQASRALSSPFCCLCSRLPDITAPIARSDQAVVNTKGLLKLGNILVGVRISAGGRQAAPADNITIWDGGLGGIQEGGERTSRRKNPKEESAIRDPESGIRDQEPGIRRRGKGQTGLEVGRAGCLQQRPQGRRPQNHIRLCLRHLPLPGRPSPAYQPDPCLLHECSATAGTHNILLHHNQDTTRSGSFGVKEDYS
jgi:hypothetical protein